MDHEKEEISIHVINPEERVEPEQEDDHHDFRFNVPPFRQMFFRYSMYGKSEVVRSSSLVYAAHHSSTTAWLQIKKLSVALVGNSQAPNLALFTPTVTEVCFMGHISYPSTAFKMLRQLTALKTVKFDIGLGGHICEFHETPEDIRNSTPEVPWVTTLEINMNHRIYQSCSEGMRNTFSKIIKSVIKYSNDSFRNLQNLAIDIPDSSEFLEGTIDLVTSNETLSRYFEIKVEKNEGKIRVIKRPPTHHDVSLPFDPCARFPTFSQYNDLRTRNVGINVQRGFDHL